MEYESKSTNFKIFKVILLKLIIKDNSMRMQEDNNIK